MARTMIALAIVAMFAIAGEIIHLSSSGWDA
jgi:hypothetical protein